MNKKGFTLVELLAVIAILAILVIIALPNVLKMFNDAKKNSFLTEAKTLAQDVSSKYISESMKGNKLSVISNKKNSLDLSGRDLEYSFELDSKGKIKNMIISDGTYCISTTKDYTKITKSDISENCSYEELHNIAGTLTKKFYEESGRTDRSLVSSVVFYSDGRTIDGSESYDVSEEKDGSVKMYVTQNSENTSLVDLTIVANGKIALPEDSSYLFAFYKSRSCEPVISNISLIEFNNSVDTAKVTNMYYMFGFNKSLILDLSGFDTSNVTNMRFMFYNSEATSLNLSSFDTAKVTNMRGMFSYSQATEIKGLNKFNTSMVTDMCGMFDNSKLTTLDLSSFDTSKVTDMSDMFCGSNIINLDLSNFDTSNVTNMSYMFSGSQATTLNLSSFDTSKVTDMKYMFGGSKATEIKGLNKFNTSKVTDMRGMFTYSKVMMLDLSSFDTSNVTYMSWMISNSNNLKTIYVSDKFNTLNVTDSYNMFGSTTNLVGGAGTVYDNSKTDKTYARIDGGTSNPGYFTLKTN